MSDYLATTLAWRHQSTVLTDVLTPLIHYCNIVKISPLLYLVWVNPMDCQLSICTVQWLILIKFLNKKLHFMFYHIHHQNYFNNQIVHRRVEVLMGEERGERSIR